MTVWNRVGGSQGQTNQRISGAVLPAGRGLMVMPLVFCMILSVLAGCGRELSAETRRPSPAEKSQALLGECAECHDISRGGGASPNLLAPRFYDVARHPSTTALSLRVFLQSMHRRMPNFLLSARERDDIIAYILSLKPNKPL